MRCNICGKETKSTEITTILIRKKDVVCCQKCFNKIDKKLSNKKNFKTKADRTSYLDSLDTIETLPKKGNMTIRVDSREGLEWKFGNYSDIGIVHNGLDTGDYSLVGFEDYITVDRKSLGDFVGTMIKGKERFNRELGRMQGYKHKYVFIEATLEDIFNKKYVVTLKNGKKKGEYINPSSLFGIFLSLEMKHNVKFLFLGDRKTCVRRLISLYDQILRKEQRELTIDLNVTNRVFKKDTFHIEVLSLSKFLNGVENHADKLKALVGLMSDKEHRYLIISKSWADVVKSEKDVNVNSLMQTVARLELEYDIRIKFISNPDIIDRLKVKVEEFSLKNTEKREKNIKNHHAELDKKDLAWIV